MLIAVLKNPYFISGILVFALLFGLGLYLDFSWVESLFASAALAVVGVGTLWWQREIW
jgi:Kef-type K+ transport system membrane component KefB